MVSLLMWVPDTCGKLRNSAGLGSVSHGRGNFTLGEIILGPHSFGSIGSASHF